MVITLLLIITLLNRRLRQRAKGTKWLHNGQRILVSGDGVRDAVYVMSSRINLLLVMKSGRGELCFSASLSIMAKTDLMKDACHLSNGITLKKFIGTVISLVFGASIIQNAVCVCVCVCVHVCVRACACAWFGTCMSFLSLSLSFSLSLHFSYPITHSLHTFSLSLSLSLSVCLSVCVCVSVCLLSHPLLFVTSVSLTHTHTHTHTYTHTNNHTFFRNRFEIAVYCFIQTNNTCLCLQNLHHVSAVNVFIDTRKFHQ